MPADAIAAPVSSALRPSRVGFGSGGRPAEAWRAGRGRSERRVGGAAGGLARAAAVAGAVELGGGEQQAGAEVVGGDFGGLALAAVVGLVLADAQPAGDDHAGALGEGVGGVGGELPPAGDAVERRGAVLPGPFARADAGGDGQA